MRLICCLFLAVAIGAAESDAPLFQQSFAPETVPAGAVAGDPAAGIAGSFCRYEGPVAVPREPLGGELTGDWTLGIWLRAKEWIEEAPSGFGTRVPPTLLALYDGKEFGAVVFRVCQRRLQVAENRDGAWASADGWHDLPTGRWVHAAVVRQGGQVSFYLNGVFEGTVPLHHCTQPLVAVRVGSIAQRTFFGDLDEATVWPRALAATELAALVPEALRQEVATFPVSQAPIPEPVYPGRELRVAADQETPLIGGLSARCLPVPWFGPGRHDLLTWGVAFNAHPAIHREMAPGLYEPGVPLTAANLPQSPFFRLLPNDGGFDLLSTGQGTALRGQLVYHRRGNGEFASPVPVTCNGTTFPAAYGAALAGVQDVDGDGVADLLLVRGLRGGTYLPDAPDGFWGGKELPNTGKDRGYSVNGHWLGYEGRHLLLWARGQRTEAGEPTFGAPLPVYQGDADSPLQWKGYSTPRAAWLACEGTTWLVTIGDIDQILALPATVEGDVLRCGEARPLLATGDRLRGVYYPHAIDVADLDGDGQDELLVSGNPGGLSILRGSRIGGFQEEPARQRGGPLAMQTLIVPCRADWDGDGVPDLIAGDASGWLGLWPGTADPLVYRAAVPLCVNGEPIHAQAGPTGSIQGPNEARWGYLNPTVGDWDGDGQPELITCDIRADLLLYQRTGKPNELSAPQSFTHQGQRLRVAWRQRPAILPARYGIAGDRPCLLHLDWDGVLSIGIPDRIGGAEIAEQRPLAYEDGQPMKLDGPTGLWGRAKFAVADWDGDGVWDVLFGTNRSDQRFFSEECARREATPFLLRNVGTNQQPVFARPVPIKLGDDYLAFGIHIAAVWPTDLDGDGREDLLVGAEDGRVYRFLRQELRP